MTYAEHHVFEVQISMMSQLEFLWLTPMAKRTSFLWLWLYIIVPFREGKSVYPIQL